MPPPLPLVLLSASMNCFNLAQSAVGYGQWHCLSSILFVLASLKIQKHSCWLEKSILPKFLKEYCLKNGRACRGDHFTTIHILSWFRFLAVLSFLIAEIFSNFFSGFQVLELTPRSLVGQNSSLQVLRRLLWQQCNGNNDNNGNN